MSLIDDLASPSLKCLHSRALFIQSHSRGLMRRILFVCTGNIFRSLTAEYALRNVLGVGTDIVVASAGTENFPHVVRPFVRDYLLARRTRRESALPAHFDSRTPTGAGSRSRDEYGASIYVGGPFRSERTFIYRGVWPSR